MAVVLQKGGNLNTASKLSRNVDTQGKNYMKMKAQIRALEQKPREAKVHQQNFRSWERSVEYIFPL